MTDSHDFDPVGMDADVAAEQLITRGYNVSIYPLTSGHTEPDTDSRIVASVRYDEQAATLYVANIKRVI